VFDTSTGKPYYVNDMTKETRWDPPPAGPPPLPEWWEEMKDAQGKCYYVNHRTKVTQWDRPTH